MDISTALSALETLSSSTSTSSSGPLNALIDDHFARAKTRISAGEDPKAVITELQKAVGRSKKEVEKGLKGWYSALGNVGKAVDKAFPPNLGAISKAYEDPPLFSEEEASKALDRVVLDSLGRRGLWEAVSAMEEETSLTYPTDKRELSTELYRITASILSHDLTPALQWCEANKAFLSSPPHPSALPYYLHRAVFKSLSDPAEAIAYARRYMMIYVPTQPVLKLITSCLYDKEKNKGANGNGNGSGDVDMVVDGGQAIEDEGEDMEELVKMFKAEFCRRYQWPKEDPLEVAVDLGSRGGALNVIEKARRVMGEHLGHVRQWTDLPMEVPLPPSRRYHSVFVCPVSKEQATEDNPPKMLSCGHVLAEESFTKLLKGGRRSAKCPYCPVETHTAVAQILYF
ncbi:hypothetical protein CI109_106420 [Kwoniella shandongensis]|uniref:GID complex catalytic subunit 2 n=1 Tax=Kwoniella shandongensis TaxID=1734106 RepID=A0A5M6C141_9TREE|nr:uncharacterized protein CI109_002603 [Kwoniella shandongensis]KAA5528846.1 hypothetical protein CI109_002603 [Kwoniella shandongensis]